MKNKYQTTLYHFDCGEDGGMDFSNLAEAKRYCRDKVNDEGWEGSQIYNSATQQRIFEYGHSPYHKLNR